MNIEEMEKLSDAELDKLSEQGYRVPEILLQLREANTEVNRLKDELHLVFGMLTQEQQMEVVVKRPKVDRNDTRWIKRLAQDLSQFKD
jgi:hypothetical protein